MVAARTANGPLYEEKLTMTMIVKDALYNSSVGDFG